MMTETLGRSARAGDAISLPDARATTGALRRFALWGIVAGKLIGGWGVQWDIQWLVMVAVDPRRRAGISSIAYGVTLLAIMTWTLTRLPAYVSMAPGTGVTLIALTLIVLAAGVAAFGARALSATLAGPSTVEK